MDIFGWTRGLANVIQLATQDFCTRFLNHTNDYLNWLLHQESIPWSVNSVEYKAVSNIRLDRPDYNDDVLHKSCIHIFAQKHKFVQWLKGKKVLVVHPFAELMKKQYELKRESLFLNPMVLPEFGELTVIKAVQSLGGGNTEFSNWFEALNSMKAQMDSIDYDVCLIGCGAYGFPLAAHAKRTGHQAIHLGGVLQLLFGIKGKRWEDPNYNNRYNYTTLFNDSWVKPGEDLKPSNYRAVEGGCYW